MSYKTAFQIFLCKRYPYVFGQEIVLLEGGRLYINGTGYIGTKGFGGELQRKNPN